MAVIALVEAYPYATICGGDGVYLERLRHYLLLHGHNVVSIVTDTARGRANPMVRLRGAYGAHHRWMLRGSLRLRRGVYLSLLPALVRNAARRMRGMAAGDGEPGRGELAWLRRRLDRLRPDAILLGMGACAFAGDLAKRGIPLVALRGFLVEVDNGLEREARLQQDLLSRRYAELAPADLVTFNNKADAAAYSRATGRGAAIVGMGFPTRSSGRDGADPVLLFVGAATACNIQSLRWFLDRCWPAIVAVVPEACFRIIGSVATALATLPNGVVAVGAVDDLGPEYAAAQVVVAPLVSGSNGVKTKVIEALSFGRALVTTSLGIEPEDRPHLAGGLLIADDPDHFSALVVRLLSDASARRQVEHAAGRLFQRLYAEGQAYGDLAQFLDARLPQQRSRPVQGTVRGWRAANVQAERGYKAGVDNIG
ncbi:glycosyltransferase family 4 protein [uncultured Sphingomonas sp.]|uniref:glycosyltransferase n=1 Tax=uncultured Sphingomonas sp. TaxID=158754 RepID=UPI0025FCBA4A|nr:glycosyltransferase family 4 protein [uncultured Sphingomonas sp.]